MKLSEFLKERENARAEKFKQCMDTRKNKRIAFYKLVSEALKDSNYWEDAVKKIKGELNIGGIRLTLNRDISNMILDIGYDSRLPRYEIRSIIDPRNIIGVDISLPTIHDPHMSIIFSFVCVSVKSTIDKDINMDDVIESTIKFFDVKADELLNDPIESEGTTEEDNVDLN